MNDSTIWLGALLVACAACTPSGEAVLELRAAPPTIDGFGQSSDLRIIATDAQGNAGKGTVRLEVGVGTLTDTSLALDEYGTARTSFTCATSTEPACSGPIEITAKWTGVTARARVTVVAPVDAGSGRDITGALAFPVGAIFADRLSPQGSGSLSEVGLIAWDLSTCTLPMNQSRRGVSLRFYDNQNGLRPGTYATNPAGFGVGSSTTYFEVEGLPDGGSINTAFARAESGAATLTRLDSWDGGSIRSLQLAGSFDVVVRQNDGGLVPLGGSFATNCGP